MNETLYLLTGGAGLLGGNILRLFLARGNRVRTLVLPGDPALRAMPREVEIIEGDLLDAAALDRFFTVPDQMKLIVIHAAGIVTMDPRPNETVRLVNVEGTRAIVAQCLKHRVRKLVYVSSTGAIPELPQGQVIREVEYHDPDQVIGYYAKTKAIATDLVLEAARNQGLDACVVYPSGIFGPDDYGFGLITSAIRMVARGKLPVAIGGSFNSVDARDWLPGLLPAPKPAAREPNLYHGQPLLYLRAARRDHLSGSRDPCAPRHDPPGIDPALCRSGNVLREADPAAGLVQQLHRL